jgi:hypothetical protein
MGGSCFVRLMLLKFSPHLSFMSTIMCVRLMMTLLEPLRKEVKCWLIQLTKCTRQLCLLKRNAQKMKLHIWRTVGIFQMYRKNNQQNLNEHGRSHHRSNTHIGLGFLADIVWKRWGDKGFNDDEEWVYEQHGNGVHDG